MLAKIIKESSPNLSMVALGLLLSNDSHLMTDLEKMRFGSNQYMLNRILFYKHFIYS